MQTSHPWNHCCESIRNTHWNFKWPTNKVVSKICSSMDWYKLCWLAGHHLRHSRMQQSEPNERSNARFSEQSAADTPAPWRLLGTAILFLGDTSACTTVHAPAAYHRARWMAKLIYCLKIYLFRSQFKLTKKEITGLQQFNLFIVTVYIKAWFTCPSTASAPRQDLEMLSQLLEYKKVNEQVASAALTTFRRHLWYLSEQLVGLAFFDDEVTDEMKVQIVSALTKEGWDNTFKRITIEDADIKLKQLPDLSRLTPSSFWLVYMYQQNSSAAIHLSGQWTTTTCWDWVEYVNWKSSTTQQNEEFRRIQLIGQTDRQYFMHHDIWV